jgi:hypothetical protein
VTFQGKHLFVNVTAGGGELRAEVLDRDSKVITGLTRDQCVQPLHRVQSFPACCC